MQLCSSFDFFQPFRNTDTIFSIFSEKILETGEAVMEKGGPWRGMYR